MSDLSTDDFPDFFKECHGYLPFAWQTRLLDFIVTNDRWPDVIDAPTGSGKTAVIDVHIFANALRAAGVNAPRRLVLAVNRRALVDSQFTYAQRLSGKLTATDAGPVCATVRDLLCTDPGANPVLLTSLRGAAADSALSRSDWRNDPVATQVISATPDMFGSRLLFRGYGTSRAARPIEAGLLAYDTVAVIDEAHLARQLVVTARRVRELVKKTSAVSVPPLQVVATTATQTDESPTSVGVVEDDLQTSTELANRLLRPKPVTIIEIEEKLRNATLTEQTLQIYDSVGATVACVVNNVKTAIAVHKAICAARKDLACALRVGPMRQFEQRDGLDHGENGTSDTVIDHEGEPIDILIATQTIEVGIDLDLHGIVTELASGSALAQRAGRVNRRGRRDEGPVHVVAQLDSKPRPPYSVTDLEQALAWLKSLPEESGLAPWMLKTSPPPSAEPSRPVFQRLEYWDADYLRHTSTPLYSDVQGADLGLWLRDNLNESADVGVAVRDRLPSDDAAATQMIDLMPPHPDEVIPTSLSVLRKALDGWREKRRAFIVKADGAVRMSTVRDVSPGDTLIVDTMAPLFRSGVVVEEDPDHVGVRDVWEDAAASTGFCLAITTEPNGGSQKDLHTRQEAYDLLAESSDAVDEERLALIVAALEVLGAAFPADLANNVVDVQTYEDVQGLGQAFVVVKPVRNSVSDSDREVASGTKEFVSLDAHEEAVAKRALKIADELGFPPALADALRLAGLLHDEGKRDERFQQLLMLIDPAARRAREQDPAFVLAKSRYRSTTRERQFRAQQALSGWRHEQRSAAHAWNTTPSGVSKELVSRLVGTTHGHGRGSFAHDARTLLPAEPNDSALRAAAEELFDIGMWERIVEETDLAYGIWGCAYLEAVLRAADVQVSAEGS